MSNGTVSKKGSSNKKIDAKIAFESFLKTHKVGKGEFHTHTAFGPPYGTFNITDNVMDEFMKLYCLAMQSGCDLHIVERPKKVGPLLVDIDFHVDAEHETRQYTQDNIKCIIGVLNSIIRKYYKWNNDTLTSFVLEKDMPSEHNNGGWKDGFHIMYPYIAMSEEMRFLVLDKAKLQIKSMNGLKNIPYTNSLDDVFDTRVVKYNGWMMYGSRKDGGQHYHLKKVYNSSFDEINIKSNFKHSDLVRILSNRKFEDDQETELQDKINKDTLNEEINDVLIKYNIKKNNTPNKLNKPNNATNKKVANKHNSDDADNEGDEYECDDNFNEESEDDRTAIINNRKEENKQKALKKRNNEIMMATKLALILSEERATSYDTWIRVGWALYNISPKLLNIFKEFSKKAGKNYNEKSCAQVWDKAIKSELGIASLRHWAREDDSDAYDELLSENINELIVEAESGTEYDVAKVVYELYKDIYRCSSINHDIWYEFQNHRWVDVEGCHTLSIKISEELTREFAILNSSYLKQMSSKNKKGEMRDTLLTKANNVMKIMNNLKKSGFKERVIKECKNLFFDKQFEENLDSNRHLIGFDNGIFDLATGTFRPGTPDDMVSKTVGYEYETYILSHPYVKGILDFFSKVQTEEDMREYILTLLASFVDGFTNNEQFIIWTGGGGNGKSKTVEFFQLALGEYCGVLPNTVLTRKRGGSGQATPELAEMKGKRFVVFQEPENHDEIQVGFMKELTGGDWIYARPLFRDPIKYKPQFKLLLTCNKLPHIPSTDGGTWRRLRVSPWESSFVDKPKNPKQFEKDPKLGEKMELWKKAFAWLLLNVYYPKYKKDGLKEPPKVTQFTKKYKKDSDIFLEWIDDQFDITNKNEDFEVLDNMYNMFKDWYVTNHAGKVLQNKKNLMEYLSNNGYKMDRRNIYGLKFRDLYGNGNDALDS